MKNFWSTEEIKNQFVHAGIAFFISIILFFIFSNFYISFISGFLSGLCVEIKQYFTNDNHDLKFADRIRDLFFWLIGGFLPFAILIKGFIQ